MEFEAILSERFPSKQPLHLPIHSLFLILPGELSFTPIVPLPLSFLPSPAVSRVDIDLQHHSFI